jgi:undecaprenyl diphosphate synthase
VLNLSVSCEREPSARIFLVVHSEGGHPPWSHFLLYESAYTELFFCDTLWPDFTEETLDLAIEAYSRR